MAEVLFWIAFAWVAYVYAGYPTLLWIIGCFRKNQSVPAVNFTPSVSVLIAARNEEKDIGWKIQQTLAWDYPKDKLELLIASDASEDCTDEIVRSVSDPRLRFVRLERRVGKNSALNRLASLAKGEILFFTDANTNICETAVTALISHFADPQVGSVTGWEETSREGEQVLAGGGRASLGYEAQLNRLESRLGSVLVCDGSIFCMRRNLFRELRPELANDLELPLWIGHVGYKLIYEPAARSVEKSTSSPAEEFQRRRRICGQGFLGMWNLREFLHGFRLWQFISRKFLRWLTLIPLAVMFGCSLLLASSVLFQGLLLLEIVFYACAAIGWACARSGLKAPVPLSFPFYFLLLNSAALVGAIEACLGRRFAVWDIPSLSRGPQQAA